MRFERGGGVIPADLFEHIITNFDTHAIFIRLELLQYLSRELESNDYFLWHESFQDKTLEAFLAYQIIIQTLSYPDNLPSSIIYIYKELNRKWIRIVKQEFLFLGKKISIRSYLLVFSIYLKKRQYDLIYRPNL